MQLRNYQIDGKRAIEHAWANGHKNVLYVLATGGGKTVLFSSIAAESTGAVCLIAHRQELVGQMSIALARQGVYHRIVGPKSVVSFIVAMHVEALGTSYYDPSALVGVAGVDTLIRRGNSLKSWLDSVTLWIQDECHHIQKGNKWGKAADMLPNARGLGVTAEPSRADGGGLGRHADGVFDVVVEGPGARELIDAGWLTDYDIVCPAGDLDLSNVALSPQTGDFSRPQLRAAVRRSRIVGDVVDNYQKFAAGRLGLTFATDVETATEIALKYTKNGIPAEVVSHKTRDADRVRILRRFRRRDLLQLVNVDLFGEGFDLPAVEVVSMARPTESFGLYLQQFGRAMRPDHDGPTSTRAERLASIASSGKPKALIIDHVGNVERHLLPDTPRPRSLDRRGARGRLRPLDAIPIRVCTQCARPYEAVLRACPYCRFVYVPDVRNAPEFVDGDLELLTPDALDALRRRVAAVDKDTEAYRAELAARYVPLIGQRGHVNRHARRQAMQAALRAAMQWYGHTQAARGRQASEAQRRFYYKFGVDVLTAQALGEREAVALAERVAMELANDSL